MKRLLLLPLLAAPAAAWAHAGPHEVEGSAPGWTWDPLLVAPLLLAALLYAVGFRRLWARSTGGRPTLRRDAILFGVGWVSLAAAVITPLHEAGERSFTMHMIEHELIMLVAALFLAISRPLATMLWALPSAARQGLAGASRTGWVSRPWRLLTDPLMATLLQAAAMWLWHAPALFDRALGHEGWHIAQHLSFLISALLFWWAMAQPREGRRGYGVSALCLFVTSLVGGALGALMALSSSPWYAGYAALGMAPFGLTPVEDQQLAGLLMWLPGGTVHLVAALVFLRKWLDAGEARHAAAR